MAYNALPLMRVLAYPLTKQTLTLEPGFALTDDLRSMMKAADAPQIGPLPPTVINGILLQEPPLAVAPGGIESHDALKWWNLHDDQDGTTLAGFTLQPCRVPYNNVIDRAVRPRPDCLCIEWNHANAANNLWTTMTPDEDSSGNSGVAGIAWHGSSMDVPFHGWTQNPLPANQSFHVQLNLLGTGIATTPGFPPYLQLAWGQEFALFFTPGQPVTLRRASGNVAGAPWTAVRSLEKQKVTGFEGPLDIAVHRIAGRAVVLVNGQEMLYTDRDRNHPEQGKVAPTPVSWNPAPLEVQGVGVAHTLRLEEYQYGALDPAVGVPDGTGQFSRVYAYNRPPGSTQPSAYAFGYHPTGGAVQQPGQVGPSPADLATVTDATAEAHGSRRYTCALNHPNPGREPMRQYQEAAAKAETIRSGFSLLLDENNQPWTGYYALEGQAMWGHETPLVHSVALRVPTRTATRAAACIDLRPALSKAHELVADPDLQPGASWTLNVDRLLLPNCPLCDANGTPSGTLVGDDWPRYVGQWHEINVDVAWQDSAGACSPWTRRLVGYITSPCPAVRGTSQWPSTLELRDGLVRMQPPAGLIDGSFAPLDLLAAEIAANGRATSWGLNLGDSLYGIDAVDYVVRTCLGKEIANRMDASRVFFDNTIYGGAPMYQRDAFFNPSNSSGFRFPPPFGDHALNWIKQIGETEFATFWAGQAHDAGGKVVFAPCYGNYFAAVAGLPTILLTDLPPVETALNFLIHETDQREDPEVSYNRVLVYAKPPGDKSDLGGLWPVLPGFSAEALIQTGSTLPEQDIDKTWRRTLKIENPYLYTPQQTSALAVALASWLRGRKQQHITIKTRGLPAMWWGWKVQPDMSGPLSDPSLGLSGKPLRVMRIANDYVFGGGRSTWESTLTVVDMAMSPS